MKRLVAIGMLALIVVMILPGCDLLDRLLPPVPEPEPDCPYPGIVCDLLDGVDFDGIQDRIDGVRDCITGD